MPNMSSQEMTEHHEWYSSFLKDMFDYNLIRMLVGVIAYKHAMQFLTSLGGESISTLRLAYNVRLMFAVVDEVRCWLVGELEFI